MTKDNSAPPDLRPLGIGETLDAAFRILRQNFAEFMKIGVGFLTPLALLTALYMISEIQFIGSDGLIYVDDPSQYESVALLLGLGSRLLQLLCFGVLVHLAIRLYMNETQTAASIVRLSTPRMAPFVGMSILLGLYWIAVTIGVSIAATPFGWAGALVAVGVIIFWATHYSLSAPAFWYEELRAGRAIGRSHKLVKKRFWAVLGSISIAIVIVMVFSVGLGALMVAAFTRNIDPLPFVLVTIGSEYLGTMIGIMVLAPIVTVVYFDGRVRREGFDLKIKLDEASNTDPTPPSSFPW